MINLNFKEKTAIVTGATRGIGKAIAESLLRLGANVIITSTKDFPQWCNEYPNCTCKTLDLLDDDNVKNFTEELSNLEKIDILINNAGVNLFQSIDAMKYKDWNQIIRINLYGPMCLIKAVSPKMQFAKRGHILNISSIAGIVAKPGASAYSSSKAGLLGLTRACALDLAPYNILVNALCPGTTDTEMVKRLLTKEQSETFQRTIPLGRFAQPKEIANFALFLCSDLNTYITGQSLIVDGGATIQ